MFFLKRLETEERRLLLAQLTPIEVEKGGTLFRFGEKADAMFFLEFGGVRLSKPSSGSLNPDGETLGVVKTGEFFGEEGILGEKNVYQATAIATESSLIHVFNKAGLEKIMAESMTIGTKILLEISKTYREILDDPESRGRLVTFYSPRDGGGKTTLAINSAILLARMTNQPVGYLDGDFQLGNGALIAGTPAVPNIAHLLQAESEFTMAHMRAYFHEFHGVSFLWGPEMPQDSELIHREVLSRILREMLRVFPWVVVDSKSYIDEQTLLFLDRADRLCLVGTPDLGFLERTLRLMRLFSNLGYDPARLVGVMGLWQEEAGEFVREFEKILQRPVFCMRSVPKLARQAEMAGQPLAIDAPGSDYVRDVEKLVSSFLGRPVSTAREGGIFARLSSFFS